jgi:putative DNA primase/helicase
MTDIVLAAALDYAARGWAVFPAPRSAKKSFKSAARCDGRAWGATWDAEEICQDFTRWPAARVGIVTGAISKIVVVETDTVAGHGVDGAATLAALVSQHGPLPETLQAISPSGSGHRYFQSRRRHQDQEQCIGNRQRH